MPVVIRKFKLLMSLCLCAIALAQIILVFNLELTPNWMRMISLNKSFNSTKSAKHSQNILTEQQRSLLPTPNAVYYFWCGRQRYFEFRHYLSVLSVFRYLTPDRIVFYYETLPPVDERLYNTWLDELSDKYPFFSREPLPPEWCVNVSANINRHLTENGGIFVHEDVIFTRLDISLRMFDFATIRDLQSEKTLVLMASLSRRHPTNSTFKRLGVTFGKMNGNSNVMNATPEKGHIDWMSTQVFNYASLREMSDENEPLLLVTDFGFAPRDIWKLNNLVGKVLRTIMYGKSDIPLPIQDYNTLAPNIAHVVWHKPDEMKFDFYLCVLSLLELARVDILYIHGSAPTGYYWGLIKDHPRLKVVYRTLLVSGDERIYGTKVKVVAHIADVWRTDIMLRYGGLYVDTDAIFHRPLSDEIRSYDAVMSLDISEEPPFPNMVHNGIMVGKPGTEFWRLYMESMKHYLDHDWLWNSNRQPYKILERHPELLHVDPHLNVICSQGNCYPSWLPTFTNSHIITGSMKNWKHDSFAVQHCWPDLKEFENHGALIKNNGSTLMGEVGLYVLIEAGKLDYFRTLANGGN